MADAREFIDFWTQNSVHAEDADRRGDGEERVSALVERCLAMAASQELSKTQIETEVGDLYAYIKAKLAAVNDAEAARVADQDRM